MWNVGEGLGRFSNDVPATENAIDQALATVAAHMPLNSPPAGSPGQHGLDFANVLHDSLSCAIIVVDGRRKITSFNPQAEQLLHLPRAVLGQSLELLPDPVQQIIGEVFTIGKAINDRPVLLRHESRGEIALRITAAPTVTEAGKIGGAAIVVNDVSSARRWEASLRRLDRLHNVGILSASMAHEVKNAFVAVKTFVDLLLEQNKDADLAEVVRFELGRIDTILGQMRKFSGPSKPAFANIHLHTVLDKSLQLIHHLLQDKNIQVKRSFAASSDWVHGDQDQLEQALINLFFNALDAMKPKGTLSVSTETIAADLPIDGVTRKPGESWLRLIIQDDGAGIAPGHLDRLFEPFFTTKPEGTGLGLAITHRIVEEHHGVITAQSSVNQGTAFSIILPVGKASA